MGDPIDMYDEDGTVYAVYENEDGETYEEVYGYLDSEDDSDAGTVDVSGDYDG